MEERVFLLRAPKAKLSVVFKCLLLFSKLDIQFPLKTFSRFTEVVSSPSWRYIFKRAQTPIRQWARFSKVPSVGL